MIVRFAKRQAQPRLNALERGNQFDQFMQHLLHIGPIKL
jgi:hypothetical protein